MKSSELRWFHVDRRDILKKLDIDESKSMISLRKEPQAVWRNLHTSLSGGRIFSRGGR